LPHYYTVQATMNPAKSTEPVIIKSSGAPAVRLSLAGTLAPLALALGTFIVFSGVLRGQFLNWDDDVNLLANSHYRGLGWAQLRWMFTTVRLGHYIPLTWLTFGLDFLLWGMRPFGYHLTNLLLHCANAVIFYFVGRRLLSLAVPGSNRARLDLAAAFSALLFAFHPLRVEAVAWITERRELLAGSFYLLTVLFYLKSAFAVKAQKARLFLLSLVFFALALMSKISGVTLPLALLAMDIYPLGRLSADPWHWFSTGTRRVWLEKIPFFLLALPAGLMGIFAQNRSGVLLPLGKFGIMERLAEASFGLSFYLWKTLVPAGLSPLYPLPEKIDPSAWPFLFSAIFVLLVTAAGFAARRRAPSWLAVWAIYVITLLPVLGFAQSGVQLAADRYTYLASFGPALLASGLWLWIEKGHRLHKYALVLMCAVPVVLGRLAWDQVKVWRDSETVWRRTLSLYPDSPLAHNDLGLVFNARGNKDEALRQYALALRARPDYALAHNNMANILAAQGRTDEAILHYESALKALPDYADAHYNLALALTSEGRADEAIEQYNLTLQAQPDHALALNNLGNALAAQGKLDEAVARYELALRERPDLAETHFNLANALVKQGKLDEAVRHYELTLEACPDLALAHNNLADVLVRKDELPGALRHYRQALKLDSSYEQPRRGLSALLRRMELNRKAVLVREVRNR